MATDGRVYEGHTVLFGMDADTDPSYLESDQVAKGVNRVFRGGKNRTRPPFIHRAIEFDNAEDEEIYRHGNFQGWAEYKKQRPARFNCVVISIAGTIFAVGLVNQRWLCKRIFTGNDPYLMHAWFCQAEDWLYIQNGKDAPIFWDGQFPSTARRSLMEAGQEMPIGTIMAYAHGRVFVSNAFDQIAASDILYGNGFTTTANTQKFTENLYWNEGGSFGMPTSLGHITGMIVVPRQGTDLRGQGELLVMSEDGAMAIEASIPRDLWKDQQVQAVTLTGRGNIAHASLIAVNNDPWFRSDDGLSSYSAARNDQRTRLSFGKMSRSVNNWTREDTKYLLQFASSVYYDNRILSTVSPFIGTSSKLDYGMHRYHRGILALDLDEASGVQGDSSFNWDGLWTGIRPCGLVKFRVNHEQKAFAFSHDHDGENRIYEITREGLNDEVDGVAKQIEWFYITKRFDWTQTGKSNAFEVKKLVGGEIWSSEARDRISIAVSYRSDNSPVWIPLQEELSYGAVIGDRWAFSLPRYNRTKFLSPDEECKQGALYPTSHGSQHQVMVSGVGYVKIDRMRLAMAGMNDTNSPQGTCANEIDNEADADILLDGTIENDYAYLIVN